MDYLDFVIKITGKAGDEFAVNVESPAGQGQSTLRLPYDPDDLVTILQALGATFRGGDTAEVAAPEEARESADGIVGRGERISVSVPKPTDVGLKLFEHLLTGEARALFNRSVGRVQEDDDVGLRLKLQLNLDDPEVARLARLPWELLYSKEEHEYLNLIGKYPLVRHLAISQPEKSEPIHPPLRVLVVMSSPAGVAKLDLDHEKRLIEESWADHEQVVVKFLEKATVETLNRELIDNEYHVLHYMGHGDFDPESGQGVLIMEDDAGNADPIPAHALSVVLRKARKMRLIFLNACETAKAAELSGQDPFAGVATAFVMANVGDVLAMQFPISDKAAIKFSQAFYWSIATGLPIDAAVSEGRSAIKLALPNSMEWATPVLFMRSDTGVFFDIEDLDKKEDHKEHVLPDVGGNVKKYAMMGVAGVAGIAVVLLLWKFLFGAPPDLDRLEWAHDEAVTIEMQSPEATRNSAQVQLGLVGCNVWGRGGVCEDPVEILGRDALEKYQIAWTLVPDSVHAAAIVGDSISESHRIVTVGGLQEPGTVTLVARVSNANEVDSVLKDVKVVVPEARKQAAATQAEQLLAMATDPSKTYGEIIGAAEELHAGYPFALEGVTKDQVATLEAESRKLKALYDAALQPEDTTTISQQRHMLVEFVRESEKLRGQGSPESETASATLAAVTKEMNDNPVLSAPEFHPGARSEAIETCTAVQDGKCRSATQNTFPVGSKVYFSLQYVSPSRAGEVRVSISGPGDPRPDKPAHSVSRRSVPGHRHGSFRADSAGVYTIRVENDRGRLLGLHSVEVR